MQHSVTKSQIQKIHVLLHNTGLIEDKKDLIVNFTNGRKTSTTELTMDEARCLIQLLSERDPCIKHRKSIVHLAYVAGIIYGDSDEDHDINKAKLDMFLKTKGTVKKDLDKMNQQELIKVHRQMEAIVNNTKKTSDNKAAKTATDKLLKELNLTVK